MKKTIEKVCPKKRKSLSYGEVPYLRRAFQRGSPQKKEGVPELALLRKGKLLNWRGSP